MIKNLKQIALSNREENYSDMSAALKEAMQSETEISQSEWDSIVSSINKKRHNIIYFRYNLYQYMSDYFPSRYGYYSRISGNFNKENFKRAMIAYSKIDNSAKDFVNSRIIYHLVNDDPLKVSDLACALDPASFPNKEVVFDLCLKRTTAHVGTFDAWLKIHSSNISSEKNKLVFAKLEKLITKQKANPKNKGIFIRAIRNDSIFQWMLNCNNPKISEGANRFITQMSAREISCFKFQVLNRLKELNNKYPADYKWLETLQLHYVDYSLDYSTNPGKKILALLNQIPNPLIKQIFLKVVERKMSPDFLIKKFPELEKLASFS